MASASRRHLEFILSSTRSGNHAGRSAREIRVLPTQDWVIRVVAKEIVMVTMKDSSTTEGHATSTSQK